MKNQESQGSQKAQKASFNHFAGYSIFGVAMLVLGCFFMHATIANGFMTPPTPLDAQTFQCQELGRRSKGFPKAYENLRKGGCGMLKPYRDAFSDAPPVPLKLEAAEASTTLGK